MSGLLALFCPRSNPSTQQPMGYTQDLADLKQEMGELRQKVNDLYEKIDEQSTNLHSIQAELKKNTYDEKTFAASIDKTQENLISFEDDVSWGSHIQYYQDVALGCIQGYGGATLLSVASLTIADHPSFSVTSRFLPSWLQFPPDPVDILVAKVMIPVFFFFGHCYAAEHKEACDAKFKNRLYD